MFAFLLKRVSLIIPTFIGVTLLTFFMIRLVPGDAIEVRSGERGISAERHAELAAELGLDKPILSQYADYVGGLFQGNFGTSFVTNKPVLEEFLTLFPATLELSIAAMLIALILGIPLGVLAAVKRGTAYDHGAVTFALTGYSMPIFWWALILILFFSVGLGWTPVSGRISVIYWIEPVTGFMLLDSLISGEAGAFRSAVSHLILPSLALSTIPLAIILRMTRSSMLEVIKEDYIRSARAKGLSPFKVLFVHALRNSLIPVITVIGLVVGTLMGGAILTETIFAWPGIGKWMIDSIHRRDYAVIQSGILIIACIVIFINLVVDILYGVINPRIRR